MSEIFESVQGEGVYLGYPALFIRLQGCNLKCWFCDTQYALNGKCTPVKMSVPEVIETILNSKSYHVVFTGGEPLLQQKDIGAICCGIGKRKFFEVETNGTIRPNISCIDLFTVSPKGNFEVSSRFFEFPQVVVNWDFECPQVAFKFVVDERKDLVKIDEFVREHKLNPVYLMPQTVTLDGHRTKLPMLFEFVREHPNYRITPRLHILAYGKKRGY